MLNENLVVAAKLKKSRENCGFTQQQVANALAVDRSTYSFYETGATMPKYHVLKKLAKIFNVPVEALLPEEDATVPSLADLPLPEFSKAVFELSKDEKALLAKYRVLDAAEKETVHQVFDKMICAKDRSINRKGNKK